MKIAVAGVGYVGLSIATLLAQDNEVHAVSTTAAKVDLINNGQSPIGDKEISEYLATKGLNLTATLDKEFAYANAECVIIATPTNYDPNTNYFDTSAVEDVIDVALRVNPGVPLVILLLLFSGAVAGYPLLRVGVERPQSMAGNLADEQARVLLQMLLKNIYRAFDFRDESVVYDKLALSVSGDLLAEVYLQNRRSFAVQQAGGAQARVKQLEVQQARAERLQKRPLGYAIRGEWTATGSVGHWGHVHIRRNRYQAIVTLDAVDGNWKITGLDLLEEKRMDPLPQSGIETVPVKDRADG